MDINESCKEEEKDKILLYKIHTKRLPNINIPVTLLGLIGPVAQTVRRVLRQRRGSRCSTTAVRS